MRKVIITKTSYLVPVADLLRHPRVSKCWSLPNDYTLVEFQDPVLVVGHSVDARSRQMAAAVFEESHLFAPFYRHVRPLWEVKALHILANKTTYHLTTTSRSALEWPALRVSTDWDGAQRVDAVCLLTTTSREQLKALNEIVRDWQFCMGKVRQLRHCTPIANGGRFVAECEFAGPCGDAAMALFMLLADTSDLTSVASVSFRTHLKDEN